MITDSRIQPQLAMKVLSHFDRAMTDNLRDSVKSRLTLKGHLHTYRCCDDVWTFIVKDIQFKMDNGDVVMADRIKIVACNSKKTGE
jgi:transcription initiation factor TFIIA small subunit